MAQPFPFGFLIHKKVPITEREKNIPYFLYNLVSCFGRKGTRKNVAIKTDVILSYDL